MKLSKRSAFVILPIILLSYCLASFGVYIVQKKELEALQKSQLELKLTELAASFDKYKAFAEAYLFAISQSDSLQIFIREGNAKYRDIALSGNIESTLRRFKAIRSGFKSFSVITPNEGVAYYFELSSDPFAEISQDQLNFAEQLFKSGEVNQWGYLHASNGQSKIVFATLIDKSTFVQSNLNQLENGLALLFAVEPTEFEGLQQVVAETYGVRAKVADTPEAASDGVSATRQLGEQLFISLEVPSNYIDRQLRPLQLTLLNTALAFTLFTSLMLFILTKRYITRPIERLEEELTAVSNKKKPNIELRQHADDELASLEKTFHELYGQLSKAYDRTRHLAQTDRLTKLYNLPHLSKLGEQSLKVAKENNRQIAFLYIDLDNFKFVNDKYGHDIGDALLKAFSARLMAKVRPSDVVFDQSSEDVLHARIGGDEFGVLVQNVADDSSPRLVAERILSMFVDGFKCEEGRFPVTASIGIALFPNDGETLSKLVSNADSAMYQAKQSGKNQLAFYSSALALETLRQREIELALKSANYDDEFTLVYMPLVKCASGEIAGFEALLRWRSPDLGVVSAVEFITIGEACGVFNQIDQWVIKRSFADLKQLRAIVGSDICLSINLSSAQLTQPGIAQYLMTHAALNDVSPTAIQLEVTETFNVDYTKKADNVLQQLRDHKFGIAIDDFGTGYTSLLQMVEYPIDMIKFDRAFIDKAIKSGSTQILPPLVELCHSQYLKVTAEGVEDREQLKYLVKAGCDYVQGFYFGKPASLQELPIVLSTMGLIKNATSI